MYVDVHVHGSNRESSVLPDVYMGKLPIMLGCRVDPHPPECPYDPLGYFIINGGGASSNDIEKLGEKIICQVYQKFGIKLVWEIKIIGRKGLCQND